MRYNMMFWYEHTMWSHWVKSIHVSIASLTHPFTLMRWLKCILSNFDLYIIKSSCCTKVLKNLFLLPKTLTGSPYYSLACSYPSSKNSKIVKCLFCQTLVTWEPPVGGSQSFQVPIIISFNWWLQLQKILNCPLFALFVLSVHVSQNVKFFGDI